MGPADGRAFVEQHHRAVLVTRRAGGGLQSSPVVVGVDGEDLVISSRETAYKVRNLRRDPRALLCVLSDGFYGDWRQITGTARIVGLPEAMDGLIAYYRRLSGEHPDWDDYRRAMQEERRVLVRIAIDEVGPTRAG